MSLQELTELSSPFDGLIVVDRAIFESKFTAARHASFRKIALREGMQNALSKSRGADKERRERMLRECQPEWWTKEINHWRHFQHAVINAIRLHGPYTPDSDSWDI